MMAHLVIAWYTLLVLSIKSLTGCTQPSQYNSSDGNDAEYHRSTNKQDVACGKHICTVAVDRNINLKEVR